MLAPSEKKNVVDSCNVVYSCIQCKAYFKWSKTQTWSLQSISIIVMKEQVSMHELFQIKKFQAEYITWKSYALPWFDLKSRRELKTVFKIGVLTRDFIAYEANLKLYCSKFNMEQLVHMVLPGNETFHMLQQDTGEKKACFTVTFI